MDFEFDTLEVEYEYIETRELIQATPTKRKERFIIPAFGLRIHVCTFPLKASYNLSVA